MRLFIVTRETSDDRRYGIGQGVGRIATELERLGCNVRYASQADCTELHRLWQPRFTRWLARLGASAAAPALAERMVQGLWAASEALRWKASHVWVHDPWLVLGLRLGLMRRGNPRLPFKLVVSEHGLGAFTRAVMLDGLVLSQRQFKRLLWIEKWALNQANAVVCPSQTVRDMLLRDLQLVTPPAHWRTISYGRPEHRLIPAAQARSQLGLKQDVPVILAMGRLAPVKRHATLLHAVALLQRQHQLSPQLMIAGDGDQQAFQQQAKALGLHHPPRLGAVCSVATALSAADIYASACGVESFGLANREAMAAGLPCVIAAGGANSEVLGHGAWLVEGSAQSIASSLAALLKNTELSAHWQAQAYQAASYWPNWRNIACEYETLLLELSYG